MTSLSRRRTDYGRRGEIHSRRLHVARLTAYWRRECDVDGCCLDEVEALVAFDGHCVGSRARTRYHTKHTTKNES